MKLSPRPRMAFRRVVPAILISLLYFQCAEKKTTAPAVSQALPVSFAVDASGDATLTYDIVVPPGTDGVQPSLSLSYLSGSGNGLLGEGFSLEGLSRISRTGATPAQDGFKGGITYASTDRFSIDGKRLMLVSGAAYGAAQTEYHTQLESWTKVVAVGQSGSGPQSFQVWTKKGSYLEYGATADSRVLATGPSFSSGAKSGSVRQWLVNKFRDLNGNTLTVSYTQAPPDSNGRSISACNGQGVSYPQRIDYTSNANMPALRSVQFVYEARPDSATSWLGGGFFSMRARLSAIRTYVKNDQGDSTLVRELRFRYQQNTPLQTSRIGTLELKAGQTGNVPSTLSWSEGQNTLVSTPISWTGPQTNSGLEGDFNGDGRTDLLTYTNNFYLGAGSGFSAGTNCGIFLSTSQNNFVGDFNGDGLSDLLVAGITSGTLYYYTNGKFTSPGKPVSGLQIAGGCYPTKCVWQGDFNGDGLSDIASCSGNIGYFNFGDADAGLLPYKQQSGMSIYMGKTFAADFNGDGLTDIFSCSANTGYLTISNFSDSTGFRKPIQVNNMSFQVTSTSNTTWVGDYNGDGMADLLAKGSDGKYRVYYATGTGFQTGKIISDIDPATVAVWPADFNNDGRLDFFAATTSSGKIYLGDGMDFTSTESYNYALPAQNTWLGDFNGDGLADLFNSLSKTIYYGGNSSTPTQAVNQAGNYITSLDNGIGSVLSLTYKPITDPAVYTQGQSTGITGVEGQRMLNEFSDIPLAAVQNRSNSIIPVQSALYVVSGWSQNDGRGNQYAWSYQYAGAKYDMSGYGFLGFAAIAETDPQQGSVKTSFYKQAFPFTGLSDSLQVKTIGGQLLQNKAYTWTSYTTNYPGNVAVTTVLNTAQDNYGYYSGGQKSHSQSVMYYDNYGNCRLSRSNVNVNNPQATWTRSTFANDPNSWQLGYATGVVQSADSSGNNPLSASRIFYSTQKNIDSVQTWFSPDNSWLTQSFIYDVYGNQTCAVSYAGDSSLTVFDSLYHCFPVSSISPPNANGMKLVEHTRYEPLYGNKVWTKDVNNNVFTTVYDALGGMLSNEVPDSAGHPLKTLEVELLPDSTGYIQLTISTRNWNGTVKDSVWNYYDALNRNYKTRQRGWNGQWVETLSYFNSNDQPVKASLPYFAGQSVTWGRSYYDAAGRLIRESVPFETNDSLINCIRYNAFAMSVTQAANKPDSAVSTYSYNLYNSNPKVIGCVNNAGLQSSFSWDLLGNIIRATDPGGLQTAAAWNSIGRNDWYYSPSSDTLFFHYSPAQKQVETTDAMNRHILYSYDALGRVISMQASGSAMITYQYDLSDHANGMNHLCTVNMENGNSRYSFAYDALGNTVQSAVTLDGHNWNENASFNPDLSIANLLFPDGSAEIYNYNEAGQPISLQRKTGNNVAAVMTVDQVNAFGQWQSYTYANGVRNTKQYFNDGTLKAFKATAAQGNALLSKSLQWTSQYRVSALSDSLQAQASQAFRYNPTGRLTGVTSNGGNDTLAYDNSGNLLRNDSVVFSYKGYQVQSGTKNNAPYFSATYDACGEVLTRAVTEAGRTQNYQYTWDAFGRIDSVFRNDTLVYSYTYDFRGARNRKRDVKQGYVEYVIAGNYSSTIASNGKQGNCSSYSLGGIVFGTFNGDSALYYHYDQNGSALLLTNQNGAVAEHLAYAPYGKKLSGEDPHVRYQFNGQPWDEDADLYYFSSRYYDPISGRFVSPDDQLGGSLVTPDALNNYAFVLNSPISLSDPTGHVGEGTAAELIEVVAVLGTEAVIDVGTEGAATPVEAEIDASLIVESTAETTVEVTEMTGTVASEEISTTVVESTSTSVAEEAPTTHTETKKRPAKRKRLSTRGLDMENVTAKKDRAATNAYFEYIQKNADALGDMVDPDDEVDYTDAKGNKKKVPRPGFRSGVVDQVWSNGLKDEFGNNICPNTGEILSWDPTVDRKQQWHMGHVSGKEYKYLYRAFEEKRISWDVVKEEYNQVSHYLPEDPKANTSHAFESPTSTYWFDTGGANPYPFSWSSPQHTGNLPEPWSWYSSFMQHGYPAFSAN